MNIEDSIEILKNSKKLYLKEKIDSDILEEAIETLITAYEEKGEECDFLDKELYNANQEIQKLQINIQKEKEKNKELYNPSDMILRYYDNGKGMQVEIKGFISKDKIREIIYPTPENYIPVEVQQSDMYKKLVKEVEE